MNEGERILALKKRLEAAQRDLTKVEVNAEAADKRLSELTLKLSELGYDPSGDVDAQLGKEIEELQAGLTALESEIDDLKKGANHDRQG